MKTKTFIILNLLVIAIIIALIGCGGGSSTGVTPTNPTATTAPSVTPSSTPGGTPDWLTEVNSYRAMAGLPAVTEDTDWSNGCYLHARYMVKNDTITHDEDSGNNWWTQEGDDAGNNGNVRVASNNQTEQNSIDGWMRGPFHGVGIIDPKLSQAGYGDYYEVIGTWHYGGTLDVLRGRGTVPSGVTFPVMWPGDGSTVTLYSYNGNETPDPTTHCGYTAPTGLPIIIQLGSGGVTPSVTSTSFSTGGTPLTHCYFDETNYTNPDSSYQSLGRSVLNMRDAVVILPEAPLTPGTTYNVSITTNGSTYSWSFTVASNARNVTELKEDSLIMPVTR